MPEPSTRVAELLAGRAQIAQTVPIAELSRLEKDPKTGVVAIKGVGQLTYFINLYVKDPPLADRRVRLALNYSIDRETIAKSILEGRGGNGFAGVFMPGELGWTPDMKPYPYDPAKAKQLLKEAGIPDGFTFEWTITQGLYQKGFETAEAAANQMAKVGIKAKLLPLEKARLLANRTAGEYHVLELTFPWSWDRSSTYHFGLTLGHPDKLMVPKWGPAPESLLKFRELMALASSTLDTEKRGAIYERLNKYTAEEGTPFNIVHTDDLWGIQKDTGWRPHPLGGRDFYFDYWEMIGKKPPQ